MNSTITRLRDAVNAHDPEAMAATMAVDYRSEQPIHPNRGFGGRAQVVENWTQMFRGVPDLQADLVSEATVGSTSWSEWVWQGNRADGPFLMKGAIVAGLGDDGLIAWMRLYMEPVEQDSAGIREAVRKLSGTG